MPRTSRTVAQKLATPTKARRRRFQRPGDAPAVDRPSEASPIAPSEPAKTVAAPRTSSIRLTPRKTYRDYAAEYAYVAGDLRRVAVVAGSLLVLLVLLSLVIRS
ncbi:MAG: hypothetical protein U0821_08825 [Chloroflexota bacterium]